MTDKFKRVFLIDDDEIVVYLSNILINRMDFAEELETYTNSEKAFEILRQRQSENGELPELILLDIYMSFDGWMFLEAMKSCKLRIPVFILSSSIDPKDKAKAFKYENVKDFITKPINKYSLDKIRRAMDDPIKRRSGKHRVKTIEIN